MARWLLMIVLVGLMFPLGVFAQTESAQPTRGDNGRGQNMKATISVRAPTRAARLEKRKAETIKRLFDRIYYRYGAAIARMEKLAGRIERRLMALSEGGQDVTAQQALLADAKAEIELAKESLEKAKAAFELVSSAQNPESAVSPVKEYLIEVREHLKEAHSILVKIITQIKGLRVGSTGEGTPMSGTPTTLPTPSIEPTMTPVPTTE